MLSPSLSPEEPSQHFLTPPSSHLLELPSAERCHLSSKSERVCPTGESPSCSAPRAPLALRSSRPCSPRAPITRCMPLCGSRSSRPKVWMGTSACLSTLSISTSSSAWRPTWQRRKSCSASGQMTSTLRWGRRGRRLGRRLPLKRLIGSTSWALQERHSCQRR